MAFKLHLGPTTKFLLLSDIFGVLSLGWSGKLLLAFDSTVIPCFSLLEIHHQNIYSPARNVHVPKWGVLFNEGGVGFSVWALRLS
jgi:hypothetical protein